MTLTQPHCILITSRPRLQFDVGMGSTTKADCRSVMEAGGVLALPVRRLLLFYLRSNVLVQTTGRSTDTSRGLVLCDITKQTSEIRALWSDRTDRKRGCRTLTGRTRLCFMFDLLRTKSSPTNVKLATILLYYYYCCCYYYTVLLQYYSKPCFSSITTSVDPLSVLS